MGLLILLIIIGILIVAFVAIYNSLVRLRNRVKNAWSQIDVQLKRRHDLIPNLVETAKGYLKHEREVLENITRARAMAANAKSVREVGEAEGILTQALKSLFAVVENYPDLKANQNMMALHEELTSTENKISFARQFYNDSVMLLNNKIQMFPSNMVAALTNFKEAEFFEISVPEDREPVKVQF